MTLALFEDEEWRQFTPLAHTRHIAQLPWGTQTLLESVSSLAAPREVVLWGRDEVGEAIEGEGGKGYNAGLKGDVLFVNARLRPQKGFWNFLEKSRHFAAFVGDHVFAVRAKADNLEPGILTRGQLAKLAKGADRIELPHEAAFKGPWQIVESNGLAIVEQAGGFEASLALPDKVAIKGPHSNLRIHDTVEIEGHVSFDTRLGPVVVREGTTVDSFSRLSGPCYVGPRNRVHSALLRGGTSVFEGCSVGGEVENSIIMPHSNKSHLGYVGDSIVGTWVNLGAGSVFSNLKNTYGSVRVEVGGRRVDTSMLKLGPVIGDMAKVSIGAMIFAGRTVGVSSHVVSLVERNVPSFTYYDGGSGKKVELLLDSVIGTQKKMMERRGMTLSKSQESFIRRLFKATRSERRRAGVRKGRIR
jgi:UDP-N-acetylglucosamine diphosphorylase/glucosamine-1-phosphate N-acetyltransferase